MNGGIVRETTATGPAYDYTQTFQSADGSPSVFEVHVAQVSERFGPGPSRRITVDA